MNEHSRCPYRFLGLVALWLAVLGVACATDTAPDLVLHGQLTGSDIHTYREVPFDVPVGVNRITVQFEYSGREEHTAIDLGLEDPQGFHGPQGLRGWTGGSKRLFTVGTVDATPSFSPGPIEPGRWHLLLGIPNIRPASTSDYTAKIWFGHPGDPAWLPAVLNPPLRAGAGWYRGDLHMHGAHSDGSCKSMSGDARVPCPLSLTVEDAARRGLDFIALSDHNAVSQANDIRELQPYYDRLLLIPSREVTTFQGHGNLLGSSEPLDFRLGSKGVPDWNALLTQAETLHGVFSINHPIRPNDERCMGCGWTPTQPVDMHRVQAIEAVNGMDSLSPIFSGIAFWQEQLNKGFHLTGIGGSDSHDARLPLPTPGGSTPIGIPTTVVHASELSMQAIVEAIRAGHVYIDTQGKPDRSFDFVAAVDGHVAEMGDVLRAPRGSTVQVTMHAKGMAGAHAEIIVDGKVVQPKGDLAIHGADQALSFAWSGDGKRHWLRANVRAADGTLLIVGNPVYLND
ncbi:CehA/McbA family metallohydrolase [Dyella telluris]|uniref:CehA/McbA family metallohydrolase n=1 Tax=Dyella telluris TaxID=2763498 RepID=A0A7G8Q011_9GAMM|nr:CehA/McbA family metallohydrolase [Dyella telluris]QNK00119.1 CehA/McbA family metallohydrolase [Dyella telluris]